MPKIIHFGEFLKTWSLGSNSVTRQVTFNGVKIGEKCQNSKNQMRHFEAFSNVVSFDLSSWQNSIGFLCSPFASRIKQQKKGSLPPHTVRPDLFTMAVSNSWFMHPGIALLQVTLEGLGSLWSPHFSAGPKGKVRLGIQLTLCSCLPVF